MKNDANIRNFIEISRNMHGKSRKMRGKSGNFRGIHSSTSSRMTHFRGRFRSFSRSFSVIFGHFWRKSFLLSVFFPFLFRLIPFHSSTPCFYALKHKKVIYFKISRFFFGGSKYSSYLCHRLQDDSSLSGRATVSPMASQPQAFFMPKSIIFPATGKRCTDMAAA